MFNIGDEVVYVDARKGNRRGPTGGDCEFKTEFKGEVFTVVSFFPAGVYLDSHDVKHLSAFTWRIKLHNTSLINE